MTEREALQELVAAIKDSPLVSHFDGEQRLSDAYNAGVAIIAAPPAPEPTAAPVDDLGDDAAMIAFRAQYPSASRAKHIYLWTPFLVGWQECAVAARAVLAALRAERDAADKKAEEWADACDRANHALAAAQAALAAAHDALTEIALAGMSLPMVCGDDEETKNRFHARRAWEFIGIAARAKTEIDAARAAAGGGK